MDPINVNVDGSKLFKMVLPQWFMSNRGDSGITFQHQAATSGKINLPAVYKKLYEFLSTRKNLTFVDVGANLGLTSLPAALNGNRVIAIEPLRANYDILEENKRLNGMDFELLNIAIDENEGTAKIYSGVQTDCASMMIESVQAVGDTSPFYEEVEVKTLDAVVGSLTDLFVKIDVQGYEMKVLNSMEKMLAEGRVTHILLELETRFLVNANTSADEINSFLVQRGFKPENFYGDDFLYIKI
jgi:FkbM family methyltransferase